VLVADTMSMRMVSASTKMHELSAEGITIVEMVEKKREPMSAMEAIYLITPTESSVRALMEDFTSQNRMQYKAAHVYFTEAIPDHLFKLLSSSAASKYILSLVEVNISFIPCESQIYSLDKPNDLQSFYNPHRSAERGAGMEKIAEQVATLCSTLGEYPSIRYREEHASNLELAQLVQQKLDSFKADEPALGEGPEKAKSQLIILDRGFDITSVLLHELTFQAMAIDLLDIQNDVYKYEDDEGGPKEVILDENDDLWVEMRHQHIADVMQNVPKKLKKFIAEKKITSDGNKSSLRDLNQMLKKMPQYKKELAQFISHLHLTENCWKNYNGSVETLCKVEQDLAMGKDSVGENIKDLDHVKNIGSILIDANVTINDKIRIILLYIQSQNGVSEENLNKLLQHAQIPPEKTCIIKNMALMGVNVVVNGSNKKTWQLKRKGRSQQTYTMSRWTPQVKDIVEDAIEDKLDTKQFPFLGDQRQSASKRTATTSARYGYGQWHKDKKETLAKNLPRIIVFMVGGCSYSEMRVAYEVTSQSTNWEVIMGGSAILTPEQFMENVQQLDSKE